MIDVTAKMLETISGSTCFGIAYDDAIPECIQCDVRLQCKAKSGGEAIPTPTVKESTPGEVKTPKVAKTPKNPMGEKINKPDETESTVADKPKKGVKEAPPVNTNLPDFKPMSTEQLKALAKDRNVEWKDYGNENITRMRLIMALKKSY